MAVQVVAHDGLLLPEYLFRKSSLAAKDISPTAVFDPSLALDGQPFISTTSPSQKPKLKTIIIDQNSSFLYRLSNGKKIALLKRLKLAGFQIFLKVQDERNFIEIENSLAGILPLLQEGAGDFKLDEDAEILATDHDVTYDDICYLSYERNLSEFLSSPDRKIADDSYNMVFFGDEYLTSFEGEQYLDLLRDYNSTGDEGKYLIQIKRTLLKDLQECFREDLEMDVKIKYAVLLYHISLRYISFYTETLIDAKGNSANLRKFVFDALREQIFNDIFLKQISSLPLKNKDILQIYSLLKGTGSEEDFYKAKIKPNLESFIYGDHHFCENIKQFKIAEIYHKALVYLDIDNPGQNNYLLYGLIYNPLAIADCDYFASEEGRKLLTIFRKKKPDFFEDINLDEWNISRFEKSKFLKLLYKFYDLPGCEEQFMIDQAFKKIGPLNDFSSVNTFYISEFINTLEKLEAKEGFVNAVMSRIMAQENAMPISEKITLVNMLMIENSFVAEYLMKKSPFKTVILGKIEEYFAEYKVPGESYFKLSYDLLEKISSLLILSPFFSEFFDKIYQGFLKSEDEDLELKKECLKKIIELANSFDEYPEEVLENIMDLYNIEEDSFLEATEDLLTFSERAKAIKFSDKYEKILLNILYHKFKNGKKSNDLTNLFQVFSHNPQMQEKLWDMLVDKGIIFNYLSRHDIKNNFEFLEAVFAKINGHGKFYYSNHKRQFYNQNLIDKILNFCNQNGFEFFCAEEDVTDVRRILACDDKQTYFVRFNLSYALSTVSKVKEIYDMCDDYKLSDGDKITNLHIFSISSSVQKDEILARVNKENITSITFEGSEILYISMLIRELPNLQYIALSSKLRSKFSDYDQLKILNPDLVIEFKDFAKATEKSPPPERGAAGGYDDGESEDEEDLLRPRRPKDKIIKIGRESGVTAKLLAQDQEEKYEMTSVGEVLNGDISAADLLVRVGIVKCEYSKGLEQELVRASKLTRLKGDYLSAGDINLIKRNKKAGRVSCLFNQELPANQIVKLLSISSNDKLVGLLKNDKEIELFKGEDGFFYARAKEDVVISYVIEGDNTKEKAQDLDKNILHQAFSSPMLMIINQYLENAQSKSDDERKEVPELEEGKYEEWVDYLFNNACGSCRHRVLSLVAHFERNAINKDNYRVVHVNNCHRILEIKVNGGWYPLDLGGTEAILDHSKDDGLYKAVLEEGGEMERKASLDGEEYDEPEIIVTPKYKKSVRTIARRSADVIEVPSGLGLEVLKRKLDGLNEYNYVGSLTEFHDILASNFARSLIIANDVEASANFILRDAHLSKRKIFYLDSPSKVRLGKKSVHYDMESKNVEILPQDEFDLFLANLAEGEDYVIMINWDNFSATQKLALNSVLDERQSIYGKKINANIISLSSSKKHDHSFLTRHQYLFENNFSEKSCDEFFAEIAASPEISTAQEITIDLLGLDDFKRHLFGWAHMSEGEIIWQNGALFSAIEEGNYNIKIQNISEENRAKLQYLVKQANACGYIEYQGYKIDLSCKINLSFAQKNFEFDKFDYAKHQILSKVKTSSQITKEFILVNDHLFDHLIISDHIEDGKYSHAPGIIAQNAGGKIPLFISSNLTSSQWYCLFAYAQKYDVKLDIALANGVSLPDQIKDIAINDEIEIYSIRAQPRVLTCNNILLLSQKIKEEKLVETVAINIEDFAYQDLFGRVTFNEVENKFINFKKIKAQILSELEAGKRIILQGSFSDNLIKLMHNFFAGLDQDLAEYSNKITIIIEDEEPKEKYPGLEFLGKIAAISYDKPEITAPKIVVENNDKYQILDDEYIARSSAFVARRKYLFDYMLQSNPMMELVGETGVGKSRLIRTFEEEHSSLFKVYREMEGFKEWANNSETGVAKILFIDESNIDDKHFTIFENIKNGQRRIFYDGEFFDLDEKHKIVFARNPHKYGGGRNEQKLFLDGKIPQLHLDDFPVSYIYHKILKEACYDKLHEDIKAVIGEKFFKEIAAKEITYQREENAKKSQSVTVRNLQERVLDKIYRQYFKSLPEGLVIWDEIFSDEFVSTKATMEAEIAIESSLRLRRMQKNGTIPGNGVGVNGILLEGDSGVGKSAMIMAILKRDDVEIIDDYEVAITNDFSKKQVCYKINASQTLEQKKQLIAKAFEEGNIIIIDEINSCIEDGLEKFLNAALTGTHPITGEKNIVNGFTMIASANSIAMEGRQKISPALRARFRCPTVKSLREYEVDDFFRIVNYWLEERTIFPQEIIADIAADICDLFKDPKYQKSNLRDLKSVICSEEFLSQYFDAGHKEPRLSSLDKVFSKDLSTAKKPSCTVLYEGSTHSCILRGADIFDAEGSSIVTREEYNRVTKESGQKDSVPPYMSFSYAGDIENLNDQIATNMAQAAAQTFARKFSKEDLAFVIDQIYRIAKLSYISTNNSGFFLRVDKEGNFNFVRSEQIEGELEEDILELSDGSKIYKDGLSFLQDFIEMPQGRNLKELLRRSDLAQEEFTNDVKKFVTQLQKLNKDCSIQTARPDLKQVGLRINYVDAYSVNLAKNLLVSEKVKLRDTRPRTALPIGVRKVSLPPTSVQTTGEKYSLRVGGGRG